MRDEKIARRYADALYALADENGAVAQTIEQLDAFVAALDKDSAVEEFFASPVVSRDQKSQIVGRTLDGKASPLIVSFIELLIKKRRESIVRSVAAAMHHLQDKAANIARAKIVAARPLKAHEIEALDRRLSQRYRAHVAAEHGIDDELLGGLTIQVGDRYVDASVAGRLEELRRHLLAAGDRLGAGSNGKSSLSP